MPQIEDPIVSELFLKRRNVVKTGLERVQSAYEKLGSPAVRIPSILIGGTNGKGTTAGFMYNLLSQCGLKIGIYSSPHILTFSERVQLSHHDLSHEELLAHLDKIKNQLPLDEYDALSFFEITTLMALLCFDRHKPDVLLMEVGMGGRWDATNVIDPVASAIVSIGFDHQEFLGNTTAEIAFEKSGIMRPERPCFLGDGIDHDALNVILTEARKRGCQLKEMAGHTTSKHESLARKLPDFLIHNFDLAVGVTRWLLQQYFPNNSNLEKVLLNHVPLPEVRWPPQLWGRYQHLNIPGYHQPLLLDACHNEDGARVFIASLRKQYGLNTKIPAMVSILGDKRVNEMLDILRENLDPIYIYKQPTSRTLERSQLKNHHRHLQVYESFGAAFEQARIDRESWQGSQLSELPLVICGSIHGMGEAFAHLNIKIERTCH